MANCPKCGSGEFTETTHAESCAACGYYYWYGPTSGVVLIAAQKPGESKGVGR